MGNLQKISQLVLLPSQVQEQTKQLPATLTPKQMQLKNGADKTAFLEAWSNPSAINQVPTVLSDVVAMSEQSVTLADIRSVWGAGAATMIVVNQLKGLFYFSEAGNKDADVQRKVNQLMETAALIVDEFYFLTMPELCSFFRRVKTGMYGQISWGSLGINVQQLFSVMREFIIDRGTAYQKLETQKIMAAEWGTIKDKAGIMLAGIEEAYKQAEENFEAFCEMFPIFQGSEHAKAWWEYFKKDRGKALKDIWNLTKKIEAKSADSSNDNLKNE